MSVRDSSFSSSGATPKKARGDEEPTSVKTQLNHVDLRSLDLGGSTGWRLHVIGSSQVQSFALEDGVHVVGRSADADLRIDDESMSRKHARLVVKGSKLTLEDLSSLNGTRVRDRALPGGQPVALASGESFELGKVMLVVRRRVPATEKTRRKVYDHSYFETRLGEEIDRRREGNLVVGRLRLTQPIDAAVLEQAFDEHLGRFDIVAEYAPGDYEMMFCDQPWDDVESAVAALVEVVQSNGSKASSAFVTFPQDGRLASALLSTLNVRIAGGEEVAPTMASHGGAMDRLRKLVERVANSELSVILNGETGVGKEVLAREFHRKSDRRDKPFVGLNCAALTETLLESELFGHERGAFSGAVATKPGLFEVADKGTVFLDEIGEMSLSIQAKLLRVLEERTVLRVGGLAPRPIDVRFLAASHRDLEAEVDAHRFRQDLYFRLNGITLEIPPLRERAGEIEGLAVGFIADSCRRSKRETPTLSREALQLLRGYAWPGNIRELRNIIERAVVLCQGNRILPEHLPRERLERSRAPKPVPDAFAAISSSGSDENTSATGTAGTAGAPVARRPMEIEDVNTMPVGLRKPPSLQDNLKDAVHDFERDRIIDALRQSAGNQTKAAEMLGISRRTLLNRLDQFNLPRPRK
jgi:two-component system, NtrC family, response regulator AtoC